MTRKPLTLEPCRDGQVTYRLYDWLRAHDLPLPGEIRVSGTLEAVSEWRATPTVTRPGG